MDKPKPSRTAKGFVLLLAAIPIYMSVKKRHGCNKAVPTDVLAELPPAVPDLPVDAYKHGDELAPAGSAH